MRISALFKPSPTFAIALKCFACWLLFLNPDTAKSQTSAYTLAASDSEFVMSLSRTKGEVTMSITFNDSLVFDYVAIERQSGINKAYSQCKYITYAEVKAKGRQVVKKDTYPFPEATDVYYRLRLVTNDGPMRTYPPIRLPAVAE